MIAKILLTASMLFLLAILTGMMTPPEWRVSKLANDTADSIGLIALCALFYVPIVGILVGGVVALIALWAGETE